MPPGTATIIVTRAGQARFQTKNTTARNRTTPIHWAEPGSLKTRSRFTNAWLRWTWNQPAIWWSAPANGLTIAKVAPLCGGREALNTKNGTKVIYANSVSSTSSSKNFAKNPVRAETQTYDLCAPAGLQTRCTVRLACVSARYYALVAQVLRYRIRRLTN